MNFSLLKVDQPKKLKSLSKSKINFFKKEEEISLFHFNELDNGLFHVVFNISDEYQVSTLKLGTQHNFVYSSLINFFFLLNEQFVLIEYINQEYQDEVLRDIKRKARVDFEIVEVTNSYFEKIYKHLNGNIKKINYSNEEEGLLNKSFTNDEGFSEIKNNYTIDDTTLLVNDRFLTVSRNGKISVDNSDEHYLTEFVKRIIHAIR